MPFPENPTDGQIYSKSGNLFIFKSGKGWSRIEPEVFFKQDTAPTISDIKGRKAIWQDTVNKIMYFWNSQINKWIYSPSACGTYVPLTPKYMTFYSQTASELIANATPLPDTVDTPLWKTQNSRSTNPTINARIPSDYQVELIHPVESPNNFVIYYFIQFKNAFNKKMALKTIPVIKANWHSSNTNYTGTTTEKPTLTVLSVKKAKDEYGSKNNFDSMDDSVYEVAVEVATETDIYGSNYVQDLTFNRPTTFNIELEATEYGLKLVNVIPSSYFSYQGLPYRANLYWKYNIARTINPYINVIVYPQSHQLQTNGSVFNIPIIAEPITGYMNIFDSADNFTGFYSGIPSGSVKNNTYKNYSGTFSIEVTGIYDVNGTPVATLTGTKTKTVTNGLAIFDDLVLTVTGHTLISGKFPMAKLTITASNVNIVSKKTDIFIYWI